MDFLHLSRSVLKIELGGTDISTIPQREYTVRIWMFLYGKYLIEFLCIITQTMYAHIQILIKG